MLRELRHLRTCRGADVGRGERSRACQRPARQAVRQVATHRAPLRVLAQVRPVAIDRRTMRVVAGVHSRRARHGPATLPRSCVHRLHARHGRAVQRPRSQAHSSAETRRNPETPHQSLVRPVCGNHPSPARRARRRQGRCAQHRSARGLRDNAAVSSCRRRSGRAVRAPLPGAHRARPADRARRRDA